MSLRAFIAELSAIAVVGVRQAYAAPPERLATANLPALYPRIPTALTAQATVLAQGSLVPPSLTVELVVVVEPVGQGTAPTNFARTVTLIDALHAALGGLLENSETIDSWSVVLTAEQVGADAYWLLVATVNGSEQ
jgi:hypothetical protein